MSLRAFFAKQHLHDLRKQIMQVQVSPRTGDCHVAATLRLRSVRTPRNDMLFMDSSTSLFQSVRQCRLSVCFDLSRNPGGVHDVKQLADPAIMEQLLDPADGIMHQGQQGKVNDREYEKPAQLGECERRNRGKCQASGHQSARHSESGPCPSHQTDVSFLGFEQSGQRRAEVPYVHLHPIDRGL